MPYPTQPAAGTGPVYFFKDPATKYCSQWYPLRFTAPLPTRADILQRSGSNGASDDDGKDSAARADPTAPTYTFECNEQYMMYSKAVLFEDAATAAETLRRGGDPKKCKALGRQVSNFNPVLWDQCKEIIVEEGNWWKFTQGEGADGEAVRAKLLATGDREIVEASPYDRIWGIGFAAENADRNRARWGQNLLGKALVRVRTRIRERDAAK